MNHKKTILILICAMVIVIGIIIVSLMLLIHLNKGIEIEEAEDMVLLDSEKVTNKTTFYRINNCINQYINYIKLGHKEAYLQINDKEVNELEYKGIRIFQSEEMYSVDKTHNITIFVKGNLYFDSKKEEKYYVVNVDYNNNAFKIEDSNLEEYTNAQNNQIKLIHESGILIEKGKYNTIPNDIINDLSILKIYFDDYKFKAIYYPEEAFDMLDATYRKAKFNDNLEQFKTYITNNSNTWQDANIVKHGVTKESGVTTYRFIDNFGNYYELRETGIYEYTIILDNYTVQSDEQIQKYNRLTDEQKALSNMDKVMKLIDEKDYSTIYNYLNQEFKNSNFPTIKSFTTYMQENFFENNIVGKIGVKQEGNVFILNVPYKESLSTAAEDLEKTFIMKLTQGMNFELSFEK